MTDDLLVWRGEGRHEITLNRPHRRNAIDRELNSAIVAALRAFDADADASVAVLTGADPAFCAGMDLTDLGWAERSAGDRDDTFASALRAVRKPVIAAVNGLAYGGGFELVLAADLVVAAEHAEFALTEVTLGMVADAGGLLRLPARLPRPIAVECLLTGRRLTAAEAARWGLVNRVVPAAELMPAARELAGAICASAPLAVAAVLEILRETEATSMRTGYSVLRSGALPAYRAMLDSQDAREGARAFADRRKPQWQGR